LTSADDRGVITFDMATLRRTGHIPAQIEGYPLNHQTGYVNGKLYKQVLAPGGVPKGEEKGRHNRLECALQHSFV
jgi:hypothetical protein